MVHSNQTLPIAWLLWCDCLTWPSTVGAMCHSNVNQWQHWWCGSIVCRDLSFRQSASLCVTGLHLRSLISNISTILVPVLQPGCCLFMLCVSYRSRAIQLLNQLSARSLLSCTEKSMYAGTQFIFNGVCG